MPGSSSEESRMIQMMNETFGWISVLGGLGMGLYMGLKFQREEWLGGYSSFSRRMVRLAHVALVALGILNIQFAQSLPRLELSASAATAASWAFISGAILMPACCLWMAARRRHFEIFAAPIACLAAAGRLLEPRNWRKCSLFDVNFRPLHTTPERLEERFRALVAELYNNEALARRHRRFIEVYGGRFREAHAPALVTS